MKIEQLIVQHLYNNKQVTLQDIGSFTLSPNVLMPTESDKDGVMPENAISFNYNTKATEDESLIEFIVQQTRKIRPLAKSDLESYSILGREYLNIGKPFKIEGLGTLQKNQNGHYDFIQGNSVNARLQAAPAIIKEKDEEQIVFTTPVRKPSNKKGGMIVIAVIFLLALAAVLIYFLNKKDNIQPVSDEVITDTAVMQKDTFITSVPLPDTVTNLTTDSSTFKVVVKEYVTREEAEKALTKFSGYGHKLIIYQADSVRYRLAIPFTTPLSDTMKTKDSLKRFFGSNTFIEL